MRVTVCSMTSRLLVTAVVLAALLAVSGEAQLSASGLGAQLLKTDAPVTGLAACSTSEHRPPGGSTTRQRVR
jgi:hypothetical protein